MDESVRFKENRFIEFFIFISFIILMFQEVLQQEVEIFKYYDEMLSLIGICIVLIYYIKYKKWKILTKQDSKIIKSICFLYVIGIISNLTSNIHVSFSNVLLDAFGLLKVYVVYWSMIILLKYTKKEKIIRNIAAISKIYILIALLFGLLNLFSKVDMYYDLRYGIRSFKFIYSNPGTINNICIAIIAILTIQKKSNRIFIFGTMIVMLLTLRGKAVAIVGVYIVLKWLLKDAKKIKLYKIFIMVVAIIVLGYNQISEYYFSENQTPRSILFKYGIRTANDYFPIGAGFGTYGSDVASKNYSELYQNYGFNLYYGLSKEKPLYLNDNFWPMILGQFGWIGAIIYIFILVQVYKNIRNGTQGDKNRQVAALTIYFSVVTSTMAAAILTSYIGTLLFFVLAFVIENDEKIKLDSKGDEYYGK